MYLDQVNVAFLVVKGVFREGIIEQLSTFRHISFLL